MSLSGVPLGLRCEGVEVSRRTVPPVERPLGLVAEAADQQGDVHLWVGPQGALSTPLLGGSELNAEKLERFARFLQVATAAGRAGLSGSNLRGRAQPAADWVPWDDGRSPPADTVGRLAGDEFLVVLPEVDRDDAVAVATRICDVAAAPVCAGAGEVNVGTSIGIALGDHTEDPAAVLRRADAAMYRAKRDLGHGYAVADDVPAAARRDA